MRASVLRLAAVLPPLLFDTDSVMAADRSLSVTIYADDLPAAYALVDMGGFLAATTHAPLTSILMLFEMTLDYDIVLPLMLACVTAHYTAKVYRRGESVYHASLTRKMASAGDDWRLRTVSLS